MGYFAEIDVNNDRRAIRIIVAPSLDWCIQTHGGEWRETCDPYANDGDVRVYCGIGYHHDPGIPEQFVSDEWTVEKGTQMQQDDIGGSYWFYNTEGQLTWYNGKAWRNLMPTGTPNVWEPPTNWREYPMGNEHPLWIQPTGAVDAYPFDFVVEHNGKVWRSMVPANTWEPGAAGSERLWSNGEPAPIPAWAPGSYVGGAEVTHNGFVWEAATDTSDEPTEGSDWFVTGDAPGPAVEPWQPWTSGLNEDLYQVGDVVTHNGQTWTATVGNNYWEPGVFGWVVS